MAFMKQEITGLEHGFRVETTVGTWYVPSSVETDLTKLADYVEGTIRAPEDVEEVYGYFGRMSAPGYLDCTDWIFDETEAGVRSELAEFYGDDEDEDEEGA